VKCQLNTPRHFFDLGVCLYPTLIFGISIRLNINFWPYIADHNFEDVLYANMSTNKNPGDRHSPHADILGSEHCNDEHVE